MVFSYVYEGGSVEKVYISLYPPQKIGGVGVGRSEKGKKLF